LKFAANLVKFIHGKGIIPEYSLSKKQIFTIRAEKEKSKAAPVRP
jgi:hypothetical protein